MSERAPFPRAQDVSLDDVSVFFRQALRLVDGACSQITHEQTSSHITGSGAQPLMLPRQSNPREASTVDRAFHLVRSSAVDFFRTLLQLGDLPISLSLQMWFLTQLGTSGALLSGA